MFVLGYFKQPSLFKDGNNVRGHPAFLLVSLRIVLVTQSVMTFNHLLHQGIIYQADTNVSLFVGSIRNDIADLLLDILLCRYSGTDGTKHKSRHLLARHGILAYQLVDKQDAAVAYTHCLGIAVAEAGFLKSQAAAVHIHCVGLHDGEGFLLQDFVRFGISRTQGEVIATPPHLVVLAVLYEEHRVQRLPTVFHKVLV